MPFTANFLGMCRHCFYPWCPGGQQEKACLDCISEIVRCKMLILGMDIGLEYWFATSCCDLDLTFRL